MRTELSGKFIYYSDVTQKVFQDQHSWYQGHAKAVDIVSLLSENVDN